MLTLVTLVLLALAAYRATRLLVVDSLFAHSRARFHAFLANRKGTIGDKLLEATSCTWCTGFWVSLGVYWLYAWRSPLGWGRYGWISAVAVAGAQGLLHAFEPDED